MLLIISQSVSHKPFTRELICVQKFVHELRITNQVMYLNPPVEEVRMNIIGELYSWESHVLTLSRITHSRYQACISHSCQLSSEYCARLGFSPS